MRDPNFNPREAMSRITTGRFQFVIIGFIAVIASVFIIPAMVEDVLPDDLTVIQAPITGSLAWYTAPGWAPQYFGTVTNYKKRNTVSFQQKPGLSIRFSHGGHATMFGTVQ